MDQADCVVVGAGVIGLAIARALAQAGREVIVLEALTLIGSGVSSRNSEVVHAGIYYPQGSLKARLCVRGRELLYDFCAERGVAHQRCGKLVVATKPGDEHKLDAIRQHAAANGVTLAPLTRAQALAMEPQLECAAALHSPQSGIVDSHGFTTALLGDAQAAGALLALQSPLESAQRHRDGWLLRSGGAEPFEMHANWLINCAGLDAHAVATRMQGFPAAAIPQRHLAKGHYFALTVRAPFKRLIYPTPVDGGLGVHLTLDLAGRARFGPDVLWLPPMPLDAPLDYAVPAARLAGVEADIRRYWPGLPADVLTPDYSGIRPKLSAPGEAAADFHIAGPAQHGCAGVVQLFGIESPGLTAAMAVAEHVCAMVDG